MFTKYKNESKNISSKESKSNNDSDPTESKPSVAELRKAFEKTDLKGKVTTNESGGKMRNEKSKEKVENLKSPDSTNSSSVTKGSDNGKAVSETKEIVSSCWDIIASQCSEKFDKQSEDVAKRNIQSDLGWKTIRVFVSSTFTDMHSEREILVKKVFPALREWCEERKFTLVECDLRWGVPKDSTSRTTICTCLEEIDRCLEENDGLPFFVSILSERYGWIPSEAEVPDDVSEKYCWIPKVSITHMEILHGAYRMNNPNAIFCLRDPSYVGDIPSDKLARFVDKEELNSLQLQVLKEKLKCKFSNQLFEYQCQVAGIDMSTGREKVNIVGLEPFAEKILNFLKEAIERQYPNHQSAQEISPEEQEDNIHKSSMELKSSFVVGRDDELEALLDYVEHGKVSPDFSECKDDDDDDDEEKKAKKIERLEQECSEFGVSASDSRIVFVHGTSGIGKSTLAARLARQLTQKGLNVFYHQVGCTSESLTSENIQSRLLRALNDNESEITEEAKVSSEKLKESLIKAVKSSSKQLVIILDGLDELQNSDVDQHFLDWLPPRFPDHLRCIVSAKSGHYGTKNKMESKDAFFVELRKLNRQSAGSMVEQFLNKFNKKLDSTQMTNLLDHESSCVPLWMSIACEELRIFGDFATVSQKIKNFPDNLTELMKDVLQRLLREDETQLMEKVLSLIHCSNAGLPEKEILKLLGNPESKEEASMAAWAALRRYLKPFIRSTVTGDTTTIRMMHQLFDQAVEELLFSDEANSMKWHTYLADYFQYHCSNDHYTIDDLPHNLYNAGLWERMLNFYREDQRCLLVSDIKRSHILSKIRCQDFVAKNIPTMFGPLALCTLCAMKSRVLSPSSFPTKDLCGVCGAWVPFKNNPATVCMKHKGNLLPGMFKCLLCQRTSQNAPPLGPMVSLNLCIGCGSGRGGMICCKTLSSKP